ncbi:hypothetical protein FRB99_000519 [Tulasnella sp. 403]|nr:hypothetical protein FRB99_000519 [Tulasnella sp. 403]
MEEATSTIVLKTNEPCTALGISVGSPAYLVSGHQDGALRLYVLPEPKVFRAVKPLRNEISSITLDDPNQAMSSTLPKCWVASGKKVFLIDFNVEKLVLSSADVLESVVLVEGGDSDDVLNEISLEKDKLLYSTDSGQVGVYNLTNRAKTIMTPAHSSICSCVSFIPGWRNEIVSGGFDNKIIHFDVIKGSRLAELEFSGPSTSEALSLSPPFVLSLALHESGCLAASTADGRLWVGRKGVLGMNGHKSKRHAKWNCLSKTETSHNFSWPITQGPIVAVDFVKGTDVQDLVVLTSTLSGKVQAHRIRSMVKDPEDQPPLQVVWEVSTKHVIKANAMGRTAGGIPRYSFFRVQPWDA